MRSTFLILFFFLTIHISYAQDSKSVIEDTYSLSKMKGHVTFLASDELEGRNTPSKGLEMAANYIASQFNEFGVEEVQGLDGFFQKVPMQIKQPPKSVELIYNGEIITSNNILYVSGNTKEISGKWLTVDFENQNINKLKFEGKVIISIIRNKPELNANQVFNSSRTNKAKALDKGAVGFVEILESNSSIWSRFSRFYTRSRTQVKEMDTEPSEFLHVMVHDDSGDIVEKFSRTNKNLVGIKLGDFENVDFTTSNVVGFVEGSDPELKEEYIICSAHYDHVGIGRPDSEGDSIYNGARDNAIGVMSVLMAAENISLHPLKRSVIFVLFTGEEKGLLGSKWMANHPPVDLKNIVFCLNSDGGGYNDTTIATIIGARRINMHDVFDKACEAVNISAFDGTDETQFLFNSSDNIVFAQKGIPALTFSMGFKDMDSEIMKYYHQPADETETIDFKYIEKFSSAFGISLREIADSKVRFFWNEGDEFYQTGRDLYEE